MVKSNYVFDQGEAIDVGTEGENDLVFESGEPVTDVGGSTLVFEEGVAIGGTDEIAFWEDYGTEVITFVESNTDRVEVSTSDPVLQGSRSFRVVKNEGGSSAGDCFSDEGAGLPNYPSRGDIFRFRGRTIDGTGFEMMFGYNGEGTFGEYYRARVDTRNDEIGIFFGPDLQSDLKTTSISLNQDQTYEGRVEWGDPTITFTLFTDSGQELTSVSEDDTRRDGGGVGWSSLDFRDSDTESTAVHDDASIIGTV